MDQEIVAARVEGVGVRLELLAGGIALPLQRLACGERKAEQRRDPAVDLGNQRVLPVEVARLAGSKIWDAEIVGDFRRPATLVDKRNKFGASLRIEKAADQEQLQRRVRNPLDPGRSGKPRGDRISYYSQRRNSAHAG